MGGGGVEDDGVSGADGGVAGGGGVVEAPLLRLGASYSEKLFWHVTNKIDSLNASIPSNP